MASSSPSSLAGTAIKTRMDELALASVASAISTLSLDVLPVLPLRIPWEVIERVIDHSCHDREALYNFSLTCHQLRPRSLSLLVVHVQITSRERIFGFCDFLDVKPHLLSLVRSITIHPNDLAPYPLLSILPGLTEISLTNHARDTMYGPIIALYQSVLTCCHRFGSRVQTLKISHLIFATCLELFRVLVAFPNLRELAFDTVKIKRDDGPPVAVAQSQRLARKLQLRTLTITRAGVDDAMAALVLEPAQATVESLSIHERYIRSPSFGQPSNWTRLRSLALQLDLEVNKIKTIIEFLKGFSPSTLREVSIFFEGNAADAIRELREEALVRECSELERELLRFPRHEITFFDDRALRSYTKHMWTRKLELYFPAMRERNAFKVESDPSMPTRHDLHVNSLAVSPNSKWIATGSDDSTIILWNSDGEIAHEWLAHVGGVMSLAFSPDSQRVASGGKDGKVSVWDVSGDPVKIGALEDHVNKVYSCAWSPDGTMIASAGGPMVRLWDAGTFQQVRVLTGALEKPIDFICFSPDARWLITRSWKTHCSVWDVASGALHADLRGHNDDVDAAVFHPNSTRIATASEDPTVRIWDVDTGEELRTLEGHTKWVNDVAFSPDGTLVISVSDDKTVKIWDWSCGAMLLSLTHDSFVNAACFSPCGRYVASASDDRTVRLWKVSDGSCVATFREHGIWVRHVAFSPDGRTLSSAAMNGTVFVRRLCDVVPDEGCS